MNEERFDQLLQNYGESLGGCSKEPVRKQRTSRVKLAFLLTAVVAVIVFGVVAMWPRDAVAGTLKRVHGAISNAKSMEVISSVLRPSGKWTVFRHSFYRDGMWRHKIIKSKSMEATYVVRGGQMLTDYANLAYATLKPIGKNGASYDLAEEQSAIDYAMQQLDVGVMGVGRSIRVEPIAASNGIPTYKIVLERAEDSYKATILVDARTDLPIASEMTVTYDNKNFGTEKYRDEYCFNQPLPDSFFEMKSSKPIIILPEAQKKLEVDWSRPIAEIGETQMRDICTTPDGTVWIVSTSPQHISSATLPMDLRVTGERKYVRSMELQASTPTGEDNDYRFDGKLLYITAFSPLVEDGQQLNQAFIQYGVRKPKQTEPYVSREYIEQPAGKPIRVDIRAENSQYPTYFQALELEKTTFIAPVQFWKARAEHYEQEEEFAAAASAYLREAKANEGFIKYAGYRPMLKAAECYRRLGKSAEAERLTKDANALKAAKER